MKVYTGGTFDCYHSGHVELLRRCSTFGPVTVALNTDDFIQRFKGRRPIMNYRERAMCLESSRYVYSVIPNEYGENSGPTIDKVEPGLIAIGSDWLGKDYLGQLGISKEFLEERGIGLLYLPYTKNISTTDIRRRILETQLADADLRSK
jgi:glycerol-3-phosphate cytidylyltransferase